MTLAQDDRQLLCDTATTWARERYDDERRRAALAAPGGFDRAVWEEIAELGWLAVALPDGHGGFGGSGVDLAALIDVLGGAMIAEPLLAVAGIAVPLIADLTGMEHGSARLAPITGGQQIAVLAHFEPRGGHDRDWIETRARRAGVNWLIDGVKAPVAYGGQADLLLVSARDEAGQRGLFVVCRDAPGVRVSPFRTVDGRSAAHVAFDGATGERLGDDAGEAIDKAIDRGAALAMAEAAGLIDTVIAETAAHLKTRTQFGRTLSSFQVLQHRCVDMYVMMQETRSTARAAAAALVRDTNSGRERTLAVAAAKVTGGRAALYVGRQAVQLHGGMGMSDEMRIGDVAKRLMVLEAMHGNVECYLDRYAALVDLASGEPGREIAT